MKNKVFLSLCSLSVLLSSVPVRAETTVPAKVADSIEVSNLVKDNWNNSYYDEAVLNINTNKVTVDGVVENATAVFGKEIKSSLDSVEEVKEYFRGTPYEVEVQNKSTVKITSPYQTKRIVVTADSLDSDYGAVEVLNNKEYHQYVLQFDTEEATEKAYGDLVLKYNCYVDEVLSMDDVGLSSYTEVERLPALSWGNAYMGMSEFRNKKFNKDVTVAVIDSGCSENDFFDDASRMSPLSYDFTTSSSEMYDMFGHGTTVAGVVYDNTPTNVKIMSLKVFNDEKKSTWLWLNSALQYAVDNNADIINMSLGQETNSTTQLTQLNESLEKAKDKGVVVCTAAGNSSIDVKDVYPANSSYTLAVSAINSLGNFDDSYSNYGDLIDFTAPGTSIKGPNKGNTYAVSTGTSFASPHVASALATIKSIRPELSGDALVAEAKKYAVDLGEKGRDKYYGEGCIDLSNYEIHKYKVETTQPTCTEEGKKTYTCEDCGYTYTEKTEDALGHEYGEKVVAPTCTEKGYTEHTCSSCGDSYKDTEINTVPHTPKAAVDENVSEPTCTAKGSKDSVVYCNVCGTEISREKVEIDAKGHSFGEWKEVTSATCEGMGTKQRECTSCGFKEAMDLDPTGHEWGTDFTVDKEPTCKEEGSKSIHCTKCEATKDSTVIEKVNHNYGEEVVTVKPTCTTPGKADRTCSGCGDVISRELPIDPNAHDYKDEVTAPTCTEKGYTKHTCNLCGNVKVDSFTDMVAHQTKTETTVVKEATCKEKGIVKDIEKCSVCGKVTKEIERELPLANHTYGNWSTVVEPTCKSAGLRKRVCTVCQVEENETLKQLNHKKSKPVIENTVEATCTKEGSYDSVISCTVCGTEISRTTKKVKALGHNYGDWEEVTASTCTEKGVAERKCKVCGFGETKELDLAQHVWNDDYTIDIEATANTAGKKSIHCQNCTATKNVQIIPRLKSTTSTNKNDSGTGSVNTTSANTQGNNTKSEDKAVQTGDNNIMTVFTMLSMSIISIALVSISVLKLKKVKLKRQ